MFYVSCHCSVVVTFFFSVGLSEFECYEQYNGSTTIATTVTLVAPKRIVDFMGLQEEQTTWHVLTDYHRENSLHCAEVTRRRHMRL